MSQRSFPSPSIHLALAAFLLGSCGQALAVEKVAEKRTVLGGLLTLEQAYDRALATDQTIRIAYWEIRKANLLPWSALAKLGPQITANGSYDRHDNGTRSTVVQTETTLIN